MAQHMGKATDRDPLHACAVGLAASPVAAELRPQALRLSRTWRSAAGIRAIRRSWVLALEAGGASAWGEAAPWGDSDADPGGALAALVARGRGRPFSWWLAQREGLPAAARMALESALLDLAAHAAGAPLCCWLAREAADRVQVNAAAGVLDAQAQARLQSLAATGYRVVKFKLGVLPFAEERRCLKRLDVPQGVALRFDANRAWTRSEAEAMLEVLGALPVEGLEEPLAEPDPAALARLQAEAPFPLALDESLRDRYRGIPPEDLPVQRLVLKPSLLGGLLPALAQARRARLAGRSVVFTSVLEGPVGLRALVHLAAAWGEGVHGLGTAEWFESPDPALVPRQGMLRVPEKRASGHFAEA